jgi:excisionase family DNA binding protein
MRAHEVPDETRTGGGHLLSINDVAAVLNVSRKTVYRLTERGELVPSRVVGRLRYRPDEIESYIERHRVRVGAGLAEKKTGA